ncbi:hypothetical protein ACVXZ0_04295 [Staphylococcus aureus]
MTQALVKLQEEDPTFHAHTDEETGNNDSVVWVSFT